VPDDFLKKYDLDQSSALREVLANAMFVAHSLNWEERLLVVP
jgi:hypothetical protein